MEFGTLIVQQVVIHKVPAVAKAHRSGQGPTLSEVPSALDDRRRLYFRQKIIASLTTQSFRVVHDSTSSSPVPSCLVTYFKGDETDFVAVSQEVARHLYACQHGNMSHGLLAVVEAQIDNSRCLVILKLEEEQGVQVNEATVGGKRTFNVDLLEGLTLTEGTRVFKAGLFPKVKDLTSLKGVVSDNQRGYQSEVEVADFFLTKFLGCKLASTPEVQTKEYMNQAEAWINDVEDDEKKARYEMALLAELGNQLPVIDAREFADRHLDVDDRDSFTREFAAEDGTISEIQKDTTLIRTRLRGLVVDYTNGMSLRGPLDAAEQVEIVQDDNGTVTTIRAPIKRVVGK